MSDAWRYADPAKLQDPEAVAALLQAVLSAHRVLTEADRTVNPEDLATAVNWPALREELRAALAGVGHPAGDAG